MKIKEPKVMQEIRRVRDKMARQVEHAAVFHFYASLDGNAAKLMSLYRSPRRARLPHSLAARAAKRRALLETLPESTTLRELRRIRTEMIAEERNVNREGNGQSGFEYVESSSPVDVLHDKPVKKCKAVG